MTKILFILKRREDYSTVHHNHKGLSTGLFNSASFMQKMLVDVGVDAELEVAIDNNCIDRLVTKHKPTHVIIEALWVVPSKFSVLTKLHPKVKWIIRLHSEMPFMAGEGMAMDWLGEYAKFPQLIMGVNAPRMCNEVKTFLSTAQNWTEQETNDKVIYMPNFYPQDYVSKKFNRNKDWVDVACFGAVRPLKNHMVQAVAALKFARKIGKKLKFHINSGRIEMKGDPVMNNLRGFFQHLYEEGHELVGHEWAPREEFLVTCSQMDIGMQCNFSETFNIVSADLISQGVPIVGSNEIPWATDLFNADPTESNEMADRLVRTYRFPQLNVWLNQKKLTAYTNQTLKIWVDYFTEQ